MPLISVVIPLYNKGFIIKKTLESVLKQTVTDYEFIIVNDGSTDDSFEIVSQFLDERIQLFQQENKGAAAARNLGIEKSNGKLIAFLDADDLWEANHLEELVKLYHDFPNCGIYCSRYRTIISKKHSINNSFAYSFPDDFRGIISDFFAASFINRVATSSSVLIPKNIIIENSCFNIAISSGQDIELWTKIAISNKVAIHNKSTAIYHFEIPNSLSKTPILKKTLINLDQFLEAERKNKSLKKFLDLYRLEYALHYKIAGDKLKSNYYLKQITTDIPIKTSILLAIPSFLLRLLLKIKHKLKQLGIDFTVYH